VRKSDIIAAAVLFFTGILAVFVIIPQQTMPGERYGLPPAFFPTLSMTFITVLSAMLLLKSIFKSKKEADHTASMTHRNWLYICVLTILLFICLAVIKYFGFIPGGILTIASFMIYMGERKILAIVLVAVLAPTLIYVILWKFLQVILA
jgi:hypothetical protein